MEGFSNLECTNCGFVSWGIRETGTCSLCGALMVNTEPTVTHEKLSDMTVEEVIKFTEKHHKDVIANEGKFKAS